MLDYESLEKQFEFLKTIKDFTILNGSKKVLLSCPHAVTQLRDGNIKVAEPDTALLAISLNALGYPCIIKTSNENDDANRDINSNYKNALIDFAKANDIKYVLDLHELAKERTMEICLTTGGDENLNLLNSSYLLKEISTIFENNDLITEINNPYDGTKSNSTVCAQVAKNDIPALQIEINSKCVAKGIDGKKFENVLKAIK